MYSLPVSPGGALSPAGLDLVFLHFLFYGKFWEIFKKCVFLLNTKRGDILRSCSGNFPLWLTPEQVIILPISEKHHDYANKILRLLKNSDICGLVDERAETTGRKIRDAEVSKIPYIIVIGQKEEEQEMISVRKHGREDLGIMKSENLIKMIKKEIDSLITFNKN